MLMRAAAAEYKWNLNYGGIALMWRGGCIIRSRFLGKIKDAYDRDPGLTNLLLDGYFKNEIAKAREVHGRRAAPADRLRVASRNAPAEICYVWNVPRREKVLSRDAGCQVMLRSRGKRALEWGLVEIGRAHV